MDGMNSSQADMDKLGLSQSREVFLCSPLLTAHLQQWGERISGLSLGVPAEKISPAGMGISLCCCLTGKAEGELLCDRREMGKNPK